MYEPHLIKNREGYFLNSYSPIKWLVCVIICFVELRKSTQPSADQCRPVLQMDIFVFELAYVVYILAFLNQIEFFHKVHIKPNKLDSTTQKIILTTLAFRLTIKIKV